MTGEVRVYTPGQQRELLTKGGLHQAAHRTMGVLFHHLDAISKLAVDRAMSVGVEEYGDRVFHLPLSQLKQETFEELADCLIYQKAFDLREKGLI